MTFQEKNTQTWLYVELYTCCSVNKQNMKDVKMGKGLIDKCMELYSFTVHWQVWDNVSNVKRTEIKKID